MCLNSSFSLQPATWEHFPRQTDQDPPPAALRLRSPESVTRAGQGGGSPKPLRRRHAHHTRCVSPLVGRRRKVHGCIQRRRRSHRRHHSDWRSLRGGAPRDKGFRPARHSRRGAGPADLPLSEATHHGGRHGGRHGSLRSLPPPASRWQAAQRHVDTPSRPLRRSTWLTRLV